MVRHMQSVAKVIKVQVDHGNGLLGRRISYPLRKVLCSKFREKAQEKALPTDNTLYVQTWEYAEHKNQLFQDLYRYLQ